MAQVTVELPDDIRDRAEALARERALPLDRLIVAALVEKLGRQSIDPALEARAQRGNIEAFHRFMAGVPDVPPQAGDEL